MASLSAPFGPLSRHHRWCVQMLSLVRPLALLVAVSLLCSFPALFNRTGSYKLAYQLLAEFFQPCSGKCGIPSAAEKCFEWGGGCTERVEYTQESIWLVLSTQTSQQWLVWVFTGQIFCSDHVIYWLLSGCKDHFSLFKKIVYTG